GAPGRRRAARAGGSGLQTQIGGICRRAAAAAHPGWHGTASHPAVASACSQEGNAMTLFIDESLTAKGFTPAWAVPQVYGGPRTIESITIHHWGVYGQTHDGVLAFFCTTGPGATSAHFVASAGRVNCIVSPEDAAWHAGNPVGNRTSIGIECRPECSKEDMQTVAELVRWLRDQYGDLPLIPHRYWQATQCPGIWDLDRIDALARGATPAPAPVPPPAEPEDEDKMLIIATAPEENGKVWIGDGVSRYHIPNPEALANYKKLHGWGLLKIYKAGDVQTLPANVLGADVVGDAAARVLAQLTPAKLADLVPEDIATAVLDRLRDALAA